MAKSADCSTPTGTVTTALSAVNSAPTLVRTVTAPDDHRTDATT